MAEAGPSSPSRPQNAAAQAALARMAAASAAQAPVSTPATAHRVTLSAGPNFNPPAQDKLGFYRLLNSEILAKASKQQQVKTIETLSKVTGNILSPPDGAAALKFRQLRLSNPQIQRNVVDVAGAYDYILLCGFRKSTVDFNEYLTFPSAPTAKVLHQLRCGKYVLDEISARVNEAYEREERMKRDERDAEAVRKRNALLSFAEDRRLRMERDQRAKYARDTAAGEGSPPVPQPRLSSGPQRVDGQALSPRDVPGFMAGTSADYDDDEEVDEESRDGTPPPAYHDEEEQEEEQDEDSDEDER